MQTCENQQTEGKIQHPSFASIHYHLDYNIANLVMDPAYNAEHAGEQPQHYQ